MTPSRRLVLIDPETGDIIADTYRTVETVDEIEKEWDIWPMFVRTYGDRYVCSRLTPIQQASPHLTEQWILPGGLTSAGDIVSALRKCFHLVSKGSKSRAFQSFPSLLFVGPKRRYLPRIAKLMVRVMRRALIDIVIVFMKLLAPLVLIRFGRLTTSRIGHLAGDVESYLCLRKPFKGIPITVDFFCTEKHVANQYLLSKWKRILSVTDLVEPMLQRLDRPVNNKLKHLIFLSRDVVNTPNLKFFGTHLTISEQEKIWGESYLESINLNTSGKFVCFYCRDETYLNSVFPTGDWSYHSYRNADINSHMLAATYLVEERGDTVIRMGSRVGKKCDSTNKFIIDYATNGDRTEFLDIYLSATCKFFVVSGGGLAAVAEIFQRPLVSVNLVPVQYCKSNSANLFIPKKIWSQRKERYLSFPEMYRTEVGRYTRSKEYEDAGLLCEENTPQEIKYLVEEMALKLDDSWVSDKEDVKLHKQFLKIFPEQRGYAQIGSRFLQDNAQLLWNQ